MSEDVNVEHLLDVFTSADVNPDDVWNAAADFMQHLYWHKPWQTTLKSKVEQLADDYRFKPVCLFRLSQLFQVVANRTEQKRLLTHALSLFRELGADGWVVNTLYNLSDTNRMLGLYEEGIQQVEEALEICEKRGDVGEQRTCLIVLARLFRDSKQFDAAEEVVLRTIRLLPGEGQEHDACECHDLLGDIYSSKGTVDKAIQHYEEALRIASLFGWPDRLFWTHYSLAELFRNREEFDDAHSHIEQAKEFVVNDVYLLGRAMEMHAWIWYRQRKFEDATSEAFRALEAYGSVGAAKNTEDVRDLLLRIEEAQEA
jgi:tetratricopeptide (TPR) repeat protein